MFIKKQSKVSLGTSPQFLTRDRQPFTILIKGLTGSDDNGAELFFCFLQVILSISNYYSRTPVSLFNNNGSVISQYMYMSIYILYIYIYILKFLYITYKVYIIYKQQTNVLIYRASSKMLFLLINELMRIFLIFLNAFFSVNINFKNRYNLWLKTLKTN